MVNANVNLVKLYFRIGKTISENSFNELPESLLKELPTEEDINLHLDIEEEP